MKKFFNNLSDLQRDFICNCIIALIIIAGNVFGITAIVTANDTFCIIFAILLILLMVFVIITGIYEFIVKLRFKWKAMGILNEWAYNSLKNTWCLYGWDWEDVRRYSTLPECVLDAVEPFYPKYYKGEKE